MNPLDLSSKRVLLTQSNDFMGPVLQEVFRELGATVLADHGSLLDPKRPSELINEVGHVDVLLANLGTPAASTLASDATEDEWQEAFRHMVDPLHRLVKAVLPQMTARGSGSWRGRFWPDRGNTLSAGGPGYSRRTTRTAPPAPPHY